MLFFVIVGQQISKRPLHLRRFSILKMLYYLLCRYYTIKLELIKYLATRTVKILSRYLKTIICKLSNVKLKEGILMGFQIRELIKNSTYCCLKTKLKNTKSLKLFLRRCKGFLGNNNTEKYEVIIHELVSRVRILNVIFYILISTSFLVTSV